VSVNAFVNRYDDLRTTEFVDGSFRLRNGAEGITYGLESWGSAQLLPSWRLSLGAATLWKDLHDKPGHTELIPRNSLGNDPKWQLTARSEHELGKRLQLTIDARAIGEIDQAPKIGSYVEAGGRLSYRVTPEVELFVAGRNLLHRTHLENNDPAAELATRSIYAGARAQF
jgi:iron complex outermembrane receptor protein